jgi:mannose-1-phosphate guanylyltransferase / mannose-6-phosphate isomerase
MTVVRQQVYPVLLSGGAGVRLWPMSRHLLPKQLLPLVTDRPMLVETGVRVSDPQRFAPPLVICNEDHRFIIAEQLRQAGLQTTDIVLEPVGRNTAPAVAVAALRIADLAGPDALILVLPADHLINNTNAFLEAVDRAAAVAEEGRLVTFGIEPTKPETGYGYIQKGEPLGAAENAFTLRRFIEKPDPVRAQALLDEGGYTWNSGMFLFRVRDYLDELARLEPALPTLCRAALDKGTRDLDFFRLDRASFEASANISIDYAVMERTDRAAVLAVDMGWTDVGTWSSLWEVGDKDTDGNVLLGDAVIEDARNCYVRSEGCLTAVVGADNLIVVVTEDAVLVAHKDKAQDIKTLVERLKKDGRNEPQNHLRVHRPWGFYQSIHTGDRFQVKRLSVKPGAKLSLQKHFHRAEHWVVVNGTALVTRDKEQVLLCENESIYLPLGAVHRLENPGKLPLNLIEVQSGSYLGEDDIVRIEDDYSRA